MYEVFEKLLKLKGVRVSEYTSELSNLLTRVTVKYVWFLLLSVAIIIFTNNIIGKVVLLFYGTFLIGDIFSKTLLKKSVIVYQTVLLILLYAVYAMRPL